MALTNQDLLKQAQTGLQATQELYDYFNNFLTVQTFGGDYMYQRLHTIYTSFSNIVTDAQVPQATPAPIDPTVYASDLNVAIQASTELNNYDQNYLLIQTFGADYLKQRLITIATALQTIQQG